MQVKLARWSAPAVDSIEALTTYSFRDNRNVCDLSRIHTLACISGGESRAEHNSAISLIFSFAASYFCSPLHSAPQAEIVVIKLCTNCIGISLSSHHMLTSLSEWSDPVSERGYPIKERYNYLMGPTGLRSRYLFHISYQFLYDNHKQIADDIKFHATAIKSWALLGENRFQICPVAKEPNQRNKVTPVCTVWCTYSFM